MKKISSPISNWSLKHRLVIGVLLLSAIGITIADLAAQTALRSYLIGQADDQLTAVAGGSFLRLDRAGIDDGENYYDSSRVASSSTVRPLDRVPSAISVTLLTPDGIILGNLGGELSNDHITEAVTGLSAEEVKLANGIPFTIENKKHKKQRLK